MLAVLAYGLWISPSFKEIAAGVAIFLFGMLAMEEGFKALTGGILEGLLARTTDRLWKSVCFGLVSTTVMQSSSLVSVVAISFLSAGMIALGAGVGIIYGANLGTTTGAWLVAGFGLKVSISAYAMPMLVFGVVLVLQRSRNLRGIGYVLAGLGFLFLGIHHMKEGFEAFKEHVDLTAYALPGLRGLVVYVAVGIVATVVMQSSHATLVLTIAALAAGQLGYENAVAVAIGSNVGTTITAILGSLSANIDGKRLAAAHLVFNLVTGVVAIGLIDEFVAAVGRISTFLGIATNDHALQLAVFHTLFNLVGIVLMLPLTGTLVRGLERVVREPESERARPRYLTAAASELPDVTVEAVRRETMHLLSNAFEILAHGIGLHRRELRSDVPLAQIIERRSRPPEIDIDERYDRTVKPLFGAIVDFVSRAPFGQDEGWAAELFALQTSCRNIVKAVKGVKHLNKNLARSMNAPNLEVRAQYDQIRIRLGEVLRQVAALDEPGGHTVTVLSLDDAKLSLLRLDQRMTSELAGLIRSNKIPTAAVTSLMNDARYATEVGLELLEVLQVLTSTGNRRERAAMRDVALDVSELRDLGVAANRGEGP
ncbi:MAG: Na/Pi cotransporter family protein [Ectothiorhodospiraceae bacterium]|nr:Na/Pi cotransporter family protein [Chromatiales bacterium]MCP5154860.1 Na/Pi cotransporter family protein [Ectothiorhodospiraceae bacterium]